MTSVKLYKRLQKYVGEMNHLTLQLGNDKITTIDAAIKVEEKTKKLLKDIDS